VAEEHDALLVDGYGQARVPLVLSPGRTFRAFGFVVAVARRAHGDIEAL
jgi:hypothetical protein